MVPVAGWYAVGMSDLIDTLVYGENETVLPTGKQFNGPAQRENFTVKDPLDSVLGVSAGEGPGGVDGDPDHDLMEAVEEARGKALRTKRALSTLIRVSAERGREALPVPKSDVIPLPQTYRNSAGEFLPGKPGGPGRPAAFGNWAKLARLLSGDGLEVMAFAFGVLRGEITHYQFHPKTGELVEMEASPALKWEIAKWIKEQGFGKEIERLDVTSGGEKLGDESEETPDLSKLTTDEVRQYLALRMKAIRRGEVVDTRVDAQAPAKVSLDIQPVIADSAKADQPVKADSAKAYSVIADGPRLLKDVAASLRGNVSADAGEGDPDGA